MKKSKNESTKQAVAKAAKQYAKRVTTRIAKKSKNTGVKYASRKNSSQSKKRMTVSFVKAQHSSTRSSTEWWILGIALFGMLLAAYAVPLHFAPSDSSLCNINETFNCDKVNKSPWSVFLGIPVSILGLLSYFTVFILVLKRRFVQRALTFTKKDFFQYILFFALFMLGFQLYLTFVEIFYIRAYCIACIGSQLCTIILTLLSFLQWKYAKESFS